MLLLSRLSPSARVRCRPTHMQSFVRLLAGTKTIDPLEYATFLQALFKGITGPDGKMLPIDKIGKVKIPKPGKMTLVTQEAIPSRPSSSKPVPPEEQSAPVVLMSPEEEEEERKKALVARSRTAPVAPGAAEEIEAEMVAEPEPVEAAEEKKKKKKLEEMPEEERKAFLAQQQRQGKRIPKYDNKKREEEEMEAELARMPSLLAALEEFTPEEQDDLDALNAARELRSKVRVPRLAAAGFGQPKRWILGYQTPTPEGKEAIAQEIVRRMKLKKAQGQGLPMPGPSLDVSCGTCCWSPRKLPAVMANGHRVDTGAMGAGRTWSEPPCLGAAQESHLSLGQRTFASRASTPLSAASLGSGSPTPPTTPRSGSPRSDRIPQAAAFAETIASLTSAAAAAAKSLRAPVNAPSPPIFSSRPTTSTATFGQSFGYRPTTSPTTFASRPISPRGTDSSLARNPPNNFIGAQPWPPTPLYSPRPRSQQAGRPSLQQAGGFILAQQALDPRRPMTSPRY